MPETTILDVEPTEGEYSLTDNLIEKLYPYQNRITSFGIEEFEQFPLRYHEVTLKT